MRVFGHYVLGSRVRVFVAEQAAASVLFLAALAGRGITGPTALGIAASCALALQFAVYLADLYEPFENFPEVRWLLAAGVGLLGVAALWRLTGTEVAGTSLAAAAAALIVIVLLRQMALTRPRRAIVLGSGAMARSVGSVRESLVDCMIVGYVMDRQADDGEPAPLPLLLDRGEVDQVAARMKADMIVVATEGAIPEEALARSRAAGISVVSAAGFASRYSRKLPLSLLTPSELSMGEGFTATALTDFGIRVLDMAVAIMLLILAAPLLIVVMIAIRLDSPGPIFYSQERVGRKGMPYLVTKLRTMRTDAEKAGPVWATANDSRVTRIGKFLRKSRIDELPQLFAVLCGDMSMVGPRPERQHFVDQLKREIPFYGLREVVKPGVTGWAQIRYPYGSTTEDAMRKLEFDLYYIRHRSLFLNLNILFHTARTVLTGRGAR
jgi:exopolysaccharide biosynthesis polyprenyl glycosylphosphotransferase